MFRFEKITLVTSVEEAIKELSLDPNSTIIAGGSDILIQSRAKKHNTQNLVSINGIKALEGVVRDDKGTIHIGPLTTFSGISTNEVIRSYLPALGYATSQAGGPQLRNVGTIGGNICNGITSADSIPSLLTYNAHLQLIGPSGERFIDLEDFYSGPRKVKKARTEVLVDIIIKKEDYEDYFGGYIKYSQRKAMDIATLGCAVQVKLSDDKFSINELRLAFGVAGPTPIRCRNAEKIALTGNISEDLIEAIALEAVSETTPRTSWRASKEFRIRLIYELSIRMIKESNARAAGLD